ncbi:MAG: glycosyltransferase [Anaerolineae bacterium]|nr:glycosyltransferase [Anaerolineae bacterium]
MERPGRRTAAFSAGGAMPDLRVLVFTHMYPVPEHPENGVFVQQQVASLRREGVLVDVLHVDVKRSKWLYPLSVGPFLRRVLGHRYDLVHAHYVFAGVVARMQLRYPVVLTHHGDETFSGWQAPLCWIVSRLVSRTIVVSEQMRKAIGLKSAAVVPCGVDLHRFRPIPQERARARLRLPRRKGLVLFAGDISKRLKRFDLAQEAVSRLRSSGHDVELVVAYKQPYALVPLYMNACDVLVLPSEREGSPQVVKEALACNLPVVCTDVGDVAEMLAGVRGCHICRRDADDIAAKVALVLERRERTDGRLAARRYDLRSIARRVIRVYDEVLRGRRE